MTDDQNHFLVEFKRYRKMLSFYGTPYYPVSSLRARKDRLFELCTKRLGDKCSIPLLEDLLEELGPNVGNNIGMTPLAVAAKNLRKNVTLNHKVFETLLKNGADPMMRFDDYGQTIAEVILFYGDEKIVSIYLPYHKEVNTPLTDKGETALHIVALRFGPNLVKHLLDRNACPHARSLTGKTSLHFAILGRIPENTELLISFGSDINAQSNTGETPLHFACKSFDVGCIDVLLKHKCKLNVRDLSGRTPIYNFIYSPCNDDSLLEKLLNAGCNIEDAAENFRPLHMLATAVFQKNAVKYADILIRRGVDVNTLDKFCYTPLHLAAKDGSEEFIELLLNNGANYNLPASIHEHPLDSAERYEQFGTSIAIVKAITLDLHLGQFVLDEVQNLIRNGRSHSAFQEFFREELNQLSATTIAESTVTFFDLYTADSKTLFEYTKNPHIVKFMDELSDADFPFYGRPLNHKFQTVLRRRKVAQAALKPLEELTQFRLPYFCLKNITRYLSTNELEMLSLMKPNKTKESIPEKI